MKVKEMDLWQIVEKQTEAGKAYNTARQISDLKDRYSKVLFNDIKQKMRLEVEGRISQAELDSRAYIDPEYKQYLIEWGEVEKLTRDARITYEAWGNLFTAKQSEEATLRAERKLI